MFSFYVLDLFLASFVQKIYLAFLCYLINLPAVYSQRLEASGLFLRLKILRSYVKWIVLDVNMEIHVCFPLQLECPLHELFLIIKSFFWFSCESVWKMTISLSAILAFRMLVKRHSHDLWPLLWFLFDFPDFLKGQVIVQG